MNSPLTSSHKIPKVVQDLRSNCKGCKRRTKINDSSLCRIDHHIIQDKTYHFLFHHNPSTSTLSIDSMTMVKSGRKICPRS
ncbi:Protein arv1 [Fusarium oxysporum f. sp. albedinis]|nr:Protein arv1 [Fusarium oxysporum f. sp. albedinis]